MKSLAAYGPSAPAATPPAATPRPAPLAPPPIPRPRDCARLSGSVLTLSPGSADPRTAAHSATVVLGPPRSVRTLAQDDGSAALGRLDDELAGVLHEVLQTFPKRHRGDGGRPLPASGWTDAQLDRYLRSGRIPLGAPDAADFLKTVFLAFARHLAGDDAEGLRRFRLGLAAARTPQAVSAQVACFFAPDAESGVLRFLPPPYAPAPGKDLSASPRYEEFRDCFCRAGAVRPKAFARLVDQLSQRVPFFEQVFTDPIHRRWGLDFFRAVGARLRGCAGDQAAAVLLYHRDCYGVREENGALKKGSGIVHMSALAITRDGQLCVSHHESIPIAKAAPVRNLMVGTLGLPTDSYATEVLQQRAAQRFGVAEPAELPVAQSFRLHGGPSGMVTRVESFPRFQAFTLAQAERSLGEEGPLLLYASDPDHVMREAAARYRGGGSSLAEARLALGPRFGVQPLVDPPGGRTPAAPTDYANHCALNTLLVLQEAGCEALGDMRVGPSDRLDVHLTVLERARLLPDTDPGLGAAMRAQWKDGKDINPRNFLLGATRLASEPGKGRPAHIPSDAMLAAYDGRRLPGDTLDPVPRPRL